MRDGKVSIDTVGRAVMNSGEIFMLPTPNTMEHREIKTPEQIAELKLRSPGGYRNLREEVINEAVSWGKYELAIMRWEEIIGRKAPAPTKPDGKDAAHRLSADFVEWMMGLPEGWVCDPEMNLKRNDQLKALGNGVVPQQAEMALEFLIDDQIMEQLGK
jgi:DNA (cytosine-5)-methyltransferase 1